MTGAPFIKMQGLGNDFVVFDGRAASVDLDPARLRAIADRRCGVGCDQIIVIQPGADGVDARMEIRNADGGAAEACGNGARCVAMLLMDESGRDRVTIGGKAGIIECSRGGDGMITVDMGAARLDWRDIPLDCETDTLELVVDYPDGFADLGPAVAVGMGNPHAVIFVDDVEAVDVEWLGPHLEHSARYPERANVEFAQVTAPDKIRMRVWERGVGITRACGTGACATGVAAARRGLTGRAVDVTLDGGDLHIEWRGDGHVLMTGPAAESFRGVLPDFLSP